MDCTKFEAQISEYLDGTLSKSDAAYFAAHVLQCRSCHSLMDDIKLYLVEVKDAVNIPDELEISLFSIQTELTPLSCEEFQELITDFLDGFVPAQTYHKFETHAEECGSCSSLLTEVVYAVAACHSVHTFEEVEVPESLESRLLAVYPAKSKSLRKSVADKVARMAAALMPRNTQTRAWNYATASGLAFAMLALMFIGVSDDGTVSGLFYGLQSKAATLYSRSTELYAQQYEVIAEFKKVRSDIGEMWQTLGGETEFEEAKTGQSSSSKVE
jgi:hypothetical protein